jgi:uncharacterized protein (DUF2236 family)
MALTEPLQRASELGGHLSRTPLRVLGVLARPVRHDLARDVRRAVGVPDDPRPPETDPARAYLDPGGVARRVHRDLPAMLIGGLSALLLQTLHPLAMAGVAEHSLYEEDPVGRLRRTAAFVAVTTYGTREEAARAVDRVRRVHQRVRGTAPDGRPYDAADPELLTWVHVAEMSSFLHAAQRFGPERFDRTECDAYYEETAAVARDLGAAWAPRSVDEVKAYFRRVRPDLYAGPQARAGRDFLLRGVARRPEDRAAYAVLAAAAVSLLPGWGRTELGIPLPPAADGLLAVPLARVLCATLRWAVSAGVAEP